VRGLQMRKDKTTETEKGTYTRCLLRQIDVRDPHEFTTECRNGSVVYYSVDKSWKSIHEMCKAVRGKNLGLEILITLVLATSAQHRYCHELRFLVMFMAVVIIISHISGATEDLHELAHKHDS
jgi:hypothetical protein